MGVSENVVYPIVPNGFADHYPVFKWLFHWEYTLFSDKPILLIIHTCNVNVYPLLMEYDGISSINHYHHYS